MSFPLLATVLAMLFVVAGPASAGKLLKKLKNQPDSPSAPEEVGKCHECPASGVTAGDRLAPPQVCRILDNNTGYHLPLRTHGDPLFNVLSTQRFCPENALAFRDLLQRQFGLELHPAMVANRGYHNPLPAGSFSFFEAVTGDLEIERGGEKSSTKIDFGEFFFGHFTAALTDPVALTSILSPQQAGTPDNLLLESVVWDPQKGMFNFYEIRGTGEGGVWFYRGDSIDILKDIRNLDRNYVPGELLFGEVDLGGARLRCSGCHMNGGPIMKELAPPHDSWWRDARPLPLGAMRIAPELVPLMDNIVDAGDFASWVRKGDDKLFHSAPYWARRSEHAGLQEQLRPLFCEQEVNLESDTEPFERPIFEGDGDLGVVRAPAAFFIDPRLLPPDLKHVIIDYQTYRNALETFDSLFLDYQAGGARPTDSMDGDHAFEAPVKSWSDMALVDRMVETGLIDEEFVADVLAIDMTRPMFSRSRCGLMRLLPDAVSVAEGEPVLLLDWIDAYKQALQDSPSPAAARLLDNIENPQRTAAAHRERALSIMKAVQANAGYQDPVTGYVRLLAQRRIEVFHAQISQHPQGQIFEPDFRLIFPTMQRLKPDQNEVAYGGVAGQYWLNPETGLAELTP